MRDRNKGFSLMELVVAVTVVGILAGIAVPGFMSMISRNRADTDVGDFYRALNYARLEAINRGVSVRIWPDNKSSSGWNMLLNVQVSNNLTPPYLRIIPAMSTSATMMPSSAVSYIEFNNLGALAYPNTALTMNYVNGAFTNTVGLCLNGRLVLNGTC